MKPLKLFFGESLRLAMQEVRQAFNITGLTIKSVRSVSELPQMSAAATAADAIAAPSASTLPPPPILEALYFWTSEVQMEENNLDILKKCQEMEPLQAAARATSQICYEDTTQRIKTETTMIVSGYDEFSKENKDSVLNEKDQEQYSRLTEWLLSGLYFGDELADSYARLYTDAGIKPLPLLEQSECFKAAIPKLKAEAELFCELESMSDSFHFNKNDFEAKNGEIVNRSLRDKIERIQSDYCKVDLLKSNLTLMGMYQSVMQLCLNSEIGTLSLGDGLIQDKMSLFLVARYGDIYKAGSAEQDMTLKKAMNLAMHFLLSSFFAENLNVMFEIPDMSALKAEFSNSILNDKRKKDGVHEIMANIINIRTP